MMKLGVSNGVDIIFEPKIANRHGLIAGATGTGKSITVKVMAEEFSKLGVPVFFTDIKGDMSGFIETGSLSDKLKAHLDKVGIEPPHFESFPTTFWDLEGKNGLALRATVSEMGPLILSKLLGLNDTQKGILYALFKIADDQGLLLMDFKDLNAMLTFMLDNRKELSKEYGNINTRSIGAIQRSLLVLESQGANKFFGEISLDIRDFMRIDGNGLGMINVLNAQNIYAQPDLYSSFILWLLSELFEDLPEVGDLDKPKLVFFFEEAHLLFQNASKALLEKVEQVVKLIRSKGVGIYFVTQNPRDIPDNVLAQLGNKVQHALRAYTPKEQKSINSIAESFRIEDDIDLKEEILSLQTGEAIVSTLDKDGIPSFAKRTYIVPPASKMGPADDSLVKSNIQSNPLYSKYQNEIDSHSAYEELLDRAKKAEAEHTEDELDRGKLNKKVDSSILDGLLTSKSKKDSGVQRMIKNAMGSVGTQVGRMLVRGILGSFSKK